MKIELHTTPDVFDALAMEWDGLLDENRSDLFFMTTAYQRVWWKHLARGDLAVLTIRDEDDVLQGIAPWFVEQEDDERVVHFVGCIDVSDYLDFVIKPGYEEQVLGASLDYMLSNQAPAWDRFALCNVPEHSTTLNCMAQLAEERGLWFEKEQAEVCPVVTLPKDFDGYLSHLDKKQRHELRRKRRRAEAQDVAWYIVGEEHNLDEEIDKFLRLMAMSTTAKAEFLKEEGHQKFFRELGYAAFEQGTLQLHFLTVDGQPAATMWQFIYGDRMLLYNSGLNQDDYGYLSAGIVLLSYSVEDSIDRGLAYYDFLRGDERYKYLMGAEDNVIYTMHIRRS